MKVSSDTILLFFADHGEGKDKYLPYDRYLKKLLRPTYKRLRGKPVLTGFGVWFSSLVKALREGGHHVVVNDRRAARNNPSHPVGLAGYPDVLQGWDLPNPAVLGPGLFDHPSIAPRLMEDPRFKYYLTTCDWVDAMFRAVYGDVCVPWYGGIDTRLWRDGSQHPKRYDVLVYDKIRWDREQRVPEVLDPIVAELERRGLRYHVLRYGHYHHKDYKRLLLESRSMVFLCEHETQGMAYQEALATGLPVLAWDPGYWVDPNRTRYTDALVPATSVPYFSPECGERFRGGEDCLDKLDTFLSKLDTYTPRAFVQRELSPAGSAETYLKYYRAAGQSGA